MKIKLFGIIIAVFFVLVFLTSVSKYVFIFYGGCWVFY